MTGRHRDRIVTGSLIDADGLANDWETENAITDTPVKFITLEPNVRAFTLTGVRFKINPTNAETYELVFLKGAAAEDYENYSNVVWSSEGAMVDDQLYSHRGKEDSLPIDIKLDTPGRLYYMTIWSGAPGNTPGLVEVEGIELLHRR